MKKFLIFSFVIVVICISSLLALSSPKDSNYNIHLVVDSWTEQDIDYPEQEFDFKNIELNKTYVIPLEGDADYFLRKFKVIKINDNSITLLTPMPLSDTEDGIDLSSTKTKFVIEADKTTNLDTLIMDAGEGYAFTLTPK